MPALPPVPQVLKVTYEISDGLDFNAIVRDFYSYTGGAPTNADAATIASDIYTSFVSRLIGELGSDNQILGVEVEDLTSPVSGVGAHIATTGGTRTGLPITAGAAVLVNKHINRRYRGGKPRSYWPFFTVTDVLTPQTWVAASVTALDTALGLHYGDVKALVVSATSLSQMVNVSYYNGFTVRPSPPIAGVRAKNISTPRVAPVVDVVTAFAASQKVASQRRRNLQKT